MEKTEVFEKEKQILAHCKEILAIPAEQQQNTNLLQEYEVLSKQYAQLLDEVKLLTSVSDRLQSKLNKANDNVTKKNEEIEQLSQVLVKAKAQRKASNVLLVVAVVFFVVTEWVIDPPLKEALGELAVPIFKFAFALVLIPLKLFLEKALQKTTIIKRKLNNGKVEYQTV